ncbi:MAG: N-acetyl-gamma-glutamyl-phosphate reductase [Spirochaetaceae bacterium]|nr:MAG: N-acetyl-gamma-glutamyl-phosphate reductase [Spirochaetaceae bacterium]
MKAAILGSSGYVGLILMRLLAKHSEIEQIIPVSSSKAGVSVDDHDPGLGRDAVRKTDITGGKLATLERAAELEPDVVFAALPHLKSADLCAPFFGQSVVIDLSADFRIRDEIEFEKAYGVAPPRPDLLAKACFGLTEWNRTALRTAELIATPGCYPTCTSLPLIPLLEAGIIEPDIWTNAISGLSGAGRSAKQNMLYVERTENMNAYSPGTQHRHVSEMKQIFAEFGQTENAGMFFIPHIVPVRQGMFCASRVILKEGRTADDLSDCLHDRYEAERFVKLLGTRIPETRHVRGTNRCDIGFHAEDRSVALFSSIDNLFKGAAGQAVQNMNVRFGFDEACGLTDEGEF